MRPPRQLSRPGIFGVAALAAAAFGLMALVGWVLGIPVLTTFGPGRIPMAPSTAVLFLLLGLLLFLRPTPGPNARWGRTARILTVLGTTLAGVLFVTSSLGIFADVEHLGLAAQGQVAGAPIGHMSPVTAFAFILVGCGILLVPASTTGRLMRARLGFLVALGVIFVSANLLVAYALGGPLLYDTGVIPPALTTAAAFLALGLALLDMAAEGLRSRDGQAFFRSSGRAAAFSVAVSLAVLVIVTGAFVYFRAYQADFRASAARSLSATVDLKTQEIAHWREECLSDASLLYDNDAFANLVSGFVRNRRNARARRELLQWLEAVRAGHSYDRVDLLDTTGDVLLADPDSAPPLSPTGRAEVADAVTTRDVTFGTLYRRASDGAVRLALIIPVIETGPGLRPVAVVRLSMDPESYLYPLLRRWPVTSVRTAETFLVRRSGPDVLVLSDLRGRPDAPLRVRVAVGDSTHPSAMAVRGATGVVEGVDYAGVPVLAALRAVPGSPWYLVASMSREEIFAPLRDRLVWVLGLVSLLLLTVAGGAGIVWQDRERRYFQTLAAHEARSRLEETQHRLTLESIGDGVITTDRRGRVEVLNRVAESLTGWTREEARGRSVHDVFRIFNESTGDTVASPVDRALAEGRVVGLANHTLLKARDGTERPIADSGAPILDEEGRILGVVLVFRDQTEEREAARLLQDREARYRSLFNSQRDAILVIDTEQHVMDLNAAFQELFGYALADVKGQDTRVFHASLEGFESMRAKLRRNRALPLWRCENTFRTKAGDTFPGDTTVFPLEDGHTGAVVGFVEILRDLTQLRRAEEEREALSAQLAQARKLESVGRLAGGVAHDFNNMLAVILGRADLAILDLPEEHPVHEDLCQIRDAAQRSAQLTEQLLGFARQQTIRPEVLDLNESLERMSHMLGRLIGENIQIEWVPGCGLWPVRMDRVQLDQILANLVVNARDAISGVGRVVIETANAGIEEEYATRHPEARPGDYVMLAVSDDGKGMESHVLEHVFEPFFTTKPLGEGTGLGLATVHGIVLQNGGFINVYSEPGHGTTFRLYLPRHQGAEAPRAEVSDAPQTGGSETILLVEDEEPLLRMATRMLDRLGYRVLAASGPHEALALADEHGEEIDLVLTDVIMPSMNGRDLADELRRRMPGLSVVYMSGYTANILDRVLDDGVEVIRKPFGRTTLSRKVREALDRAVERRQATDPPPGT